VRAHEREGWQLKTHANAHPCRANSSTVQFLGDRDHSDPTFRLNAADYRKHIRGEAIGLCALDLPPDLARLSDVGRVSQCSTLSVLGR
jgi:hypothetical protein